MMRNIKCGELKITQVTLTLDDQSITYPYGVLEYVLVIIYDLLFPADFGILCMPKHFETPLVLGWRFLATCRALIDVEIEELIFRFNKEQVVSNVFEVVKHKKEKLQCY